MQAGSASEMGNTRAHMLTQYTKRCLGRCICTTSTPWLVHVAGPEPGVSVLSGIPGASVPGCLALAWMMAMDPTVRHCSCEKAHAVAALKVYKNDVDQAVTSITKSRPRRLLSTTRYRLDFEDKVVDLRPDVDIRASHGYITENKGSDTPRGIKDANSVQRQGTHDAHNCPESPV